MRKFIKYLFISILCLPVLVIVFFIGYEILGMAVNHTATAWQTRQIVKTLKQANAEIIDTYSFTGNTGGTGNHVEMLSVVAVKTTEIENVKPALEKHECDIFPCEQAAEWEYEYYLEQLDLPADTEDCYFIMACKFTLFEDNIEGH